MQMLTRNAIQYLSGLCLGRSPRTRPWTSVLIPKAPKLALLGDIGSPTAPDTIAFLDWTMEQYEEVLWVPGNEELTTTGSWSSSIDALWALQKRYSRLTMGFKYTRPLYKGPRSHQLISTSLWCIHPTHSNLVTPSRRISIDRALNEEEWVQKMVRCNQSVSTPILLCTYGPLLYSVESSKVPIILLNAWNPQQINVTGYLSSNLWISQNDARYSGFRKDAIVDL